jgi:hypothetical protein
MGTLSVARQTKFASGERPMFDRGSFAGASLAMATGTGVAQLQRVERIVVPLAAGDVQDQLATASASSITAMA